MIVFVTTVGYEFTVKSLVEQRFEHQLPFVRAMTYDQLFRACQVPEATYVFSDIERLQPHERELAGDLYRGFGEAGLVRLNDPLKVKTRYALLRALHSAGINPFDVYRADDRPKPKRFPVFLRREADHVGPLGDLIESQDELDERLDGLPKAGVSPSGVIVTEFCAEPVAPGIWRRFGSFRIGDAMLLSQHVTDGSWCVKYGDPKVPTAALLEESLEAVRANRFVETIRPAFEIGAIEYGRADHAAVDGKHVIYEINTNPMIGSGRFRQEVPAIVVEREAIVRQRFAELLWNIDSGSGKDVTFPRSERLTNLSRKSEGHEVRIARLDAGLRKATSDLEKARKHVGVLKERAATFERLHDDLIRSSSWRITAPIREIARTWRKLTRRIRSPQQANPKPEFRPDGE